MRVLAFLLALALQFAPSAPTNLRILESSVMATAPSFIQEAETLWNSSADKTTASFAVLANDVLVAWVVTANGSGDEVVTVSGGSLVWTERQTVDVNTYTVTSIWTAVVDVDKSMTVSLTVTNEAAAWRGMNVETWRGSDGVGASSKANASGAPTLNLLTTQANSAIVWALGDWNATAGTRTARTGAGAFTSQTAFLDAAQYGVYGGHHADAGAIGTYAVGQSAPSGQKYALVAVEIKGAAGGGGGSFNASWARGSNVILQPGIR